MLENKGRWDRIRLEEIPANSSTIEISGNALRQAKSNFDIHFNNDCHSLLLSDGNFVAEIMRKRDISRHTRYFEENGTLSFRIITDRELKQSMDYFLDQHARQWQSRQMESAFLKKENKEFLIYLAQVLIRKDKLHLWSLNFNDVPIAFQFGFNHNNKYLAYCQSYDISFSKFAPSMILFRFLIAEYSKKNYSEVDFSRGSEQYKFRFSNKKTSNFGISINKSSISNLVGKGYNRIKEKIMKNPSLHEKINKYKSKLSNIL